MLDTSTVMKVAVGLFNAESFQLSDAEMPDKTGLWGVLRVLNECPKRFSDGGRLPMGLASAVGQIFVPSWTAATVGAPQPTGGTSPEPPRRSMRTLNTTDFYKPTGKMKYLERRESREGLFEFTPADFEEAAVMEEQTALDDALGDIGKSEAPKRHAAAPFLLFAARKQAQRTGVYLRADGRNCLKNYGFLFRNFRDSAENSDIYRGFRGFRY